MMVLRRRYLATGYLANGYFANGLNVIRCAERYGAAVAFLMLLAVISGASM